MNAYITGFGSYLPGIPLATTDTWGPPLSPNASRSLLAMRSASTDRRAEQAK